MIFNFVVSKEVCILYASLNLVGVRREFAKIDTIHRAVGSSKIQGGQLVSQGLLKEKVLLLFLHKIQGVGDPSCPPVPTALHSVKTWLFRSGNTKPRSLQKLTNLA